MQLWNLVISKLDDLCPLAPAFIWSHSELLFKSSLKVALAGDYRMAPGWTSYHNRLQYQIYDVAELLGAAPQAKPLYEAVVNALNQKEAEKGND